MITILYINNNFSIPNNINNKIFITKDGSGAIIYLLNTDKNILILKVFTKKTQFDIEYKNYLKINKLVKDTFYQKFIIQYLACIEYKDEYIIFMNKIDYLIDSTFLKSINNIEQKYILYQILFIIYSFNNIYSIYFNDLYYNLNIKNIMINNNEIPSSYNFEFNNFKFNIIFNKYKVKFIDYGFITNYPSLHTLIYMELYFNELFNLNIISEVLLYTFFYLIEIYSNNNNIIMDKLNNIINIIFSNNNIEHIVKNFDSLFINILFNTL